MIIRQRSLLVVLPLVVGLGACASPNDGMKSLWLGVAITQGGLREQCDTLRLLTHVASIVKDTRRVRQVRAGIAAYCEGAPITDLSTAIGTLGGIIDAVQSEPR